MERPGSTLLLALLATLPAAPAPVAHRPASFAFETYRARSFVIDNRTGQDVRFVVGSEWTDGRSCKPFHVWVPAWGGAGFDLANGDLYDPNNRGALGKVRIVWVKLDNIDNDKNFYTVEMTDMYGNEPKRKIDGPHHFLVEKDGRAYRVRTFLRSDAGKGL